MPSLPPVTHALLLINVALYCIEVIVGPWLTRWFALWPVGPYFLPWQLLTYSVLHGSFLHLAFNMLGLWMFGAELERVWGTRRFVYFWFASVLVAGMTQLLVASLIGSFSPTVGASGGLYGLLLGFGMLFPNRIIVPLIPPIPMRARNFVILFGAIELVFGLSSPGGGVAHFAHLGGMLGGWLTIRYWRGQPPFGRRRR